jgi:GTPase SAR1 family protein
MEAQPLKIVFRGDHDIGKTTLLLRRTTGAFPKSLSIIPSGYGQYEEPQNKGVLEVNGHLVHATYWDTAPRQDYAVLKRLAYEGAQVVAICYSVARVASFRNLEQLIAEADALAPLARRLLVGLCVDLRSESSSSGSVTFGAGEQAARRLGFDGFVECSSLTGEGVDLAFEEATRVGLLGSRPPRKPRACHFL